MMPVVADAQFIRILKLGAIAAAIGACLSGALFFLDGTLREIAAGTVAGLVVAVAASLADAYRRRGPAPVGRAAVGKKARWSRASVTIGAVLGSLLLILVRVFQAEWLLGGFFVGLFLFLGLMLSPLFPGPPNRRPPPPASSRMTSMERAARTPYE